MPAINTLLFTNSPALLVRDVTLLATDDLQTHRQKLARTILDEMYQFVWPLDADGKVLDINRVAHEGAGLRLDEIQGKPFGRPAGGSSLKRLRTYSVRSFSRPVPENSTAGTSRYTGMRRAKRPLSSTSPWSPFETAAGTRTRLVGNGSGPVAERIAGCPVAATRRMRINRRRRIDEGIRLVRGWLARKEK